METKYGARAVSRRCCTKDAVEHSRQTLSLGDDEIGIYESSGAETAPDKELVDSQCQLYQVPMLKL